MFASGFPTNGFQHLVWVKVNHAIGGHASVHRLGDLRRSPDKDVSIPDGRQAKFGVGTDFYPRIADMVLDRCEPWFLGKTEEGPLHRVALVTDWNVRKIGCEQVWLLVSFWRRTFGHRIYDKS